jgi:hypothetical protein
MMRRGTGFWIAWWFVTIDSLHDTPRWRVARRRRLARRLDYIQQRWDEERHARR